MRRQITIKRSGNLLSVPYSDLVYKAFDRSIRYTKKIFYEGEELRNRKAMLRQNPSLNINPNFEAQPRHLFQVTEDNSTILCLAGLLDRVKSLVREIGFEPVFEDLRVNTLPAANWEKLVQIPDLQFRHRQDEVLNAIDSYPGGLIAAPTGYGKTMIMTMLGLVYPDSQIVVFSPGVDLLRSTFSRMKSVFPTQVGRVGDGHYETGRRITLASIDSAHKVDITKAKLILADEVHEMGTDHRIAALCSQYTDAKWFGFSASIGCRADGGDAELEALFGSKIVDITYQEAVRRGVVSPIELDMVRVPGDITSPAIDTAWPTVVKKRRAYWQHTHRNEIIAKAVNKARNSFEDGEDPQTLVMVATVEHAFNLRQHLPGYGLVYGNLSQKLRDKMIQQQLMDPNEEMDSPRRAHMLRQFEAGNFKKVIATQCWKKGIDPVHLKVFCRADGETSEINSIQLPGRLSRVTEGKDKGILIDMDDSWDAWARKRADVRKKQYKKSGFVVKPQALAPGHSMLGTT